MHTCRAGDCYQQIPDDELVCATCAKLNDDEEAQDDDDEDWETEDWEE